MGRHWHAPGRCESRNDQGIRCAKTKGHLGDHVAHVTPADLAGRVVDVRGWGPAEAGPTVVSWR